MYYANVSFIKDHLRAHMLRSVLVHSGSVQDLEAAAATADWPLAGVQKAAARNAADVRYVILDMSPVRRGSQAGRLVFVGTGCLDIERLVSLHSDAVLIAFNDI